MKEVNVHLIAIISCAIILLLLIEPTYLWTAQNLIRIKPSEDMDGFFVALFERQEDIVPTNSPPSIPSDSHPNTATRERRKKRKRKQKDKKV